MNGRPVILAVDADADALRRVAGELHRRYGDDYRIVCETTPGDALASLAEMNSARERIALVLADRACTELLERVRALYPTARRGLLVPWGGWGDEQTALAIREAMASGRIDYYVLEPWTMPDEYFHRTVTELLLEWRRSDPSVQREISVVAESGEPRTQEIRSLLARSGVPHTFHASDSPEGRRLLEEKVEAGARLPVVILVDGTVLSDPTNTELASGYRVPTELLRHDFDVVIVGAGPAGLAAAVYASSEGLEALVVEPASIGGQAGWSSRIRNYLGFPRGLTGSELAQRAYQQAWVFGTHFVLTKEVVALRVRDDAHVLEISDGSEVRARSVVLAMGVRYRRLAVPALEELTNRGVFYGTSPADAPQFSGKHVVIVGGGNSAGQGAVHLARYADSVTVVVRGHSLAASMSRYLRDEIATHENVTVRYATEVVDASGDGRLQRIALRDGEGEIEWIPADGLFVLIGAHPHTDWLPAEIVRDEYGYVVTDDDLGPAWPLERPAHMYETSVPGVFAVGDARFRSVKRVAAAVGAGSVVIQQVHRYLEEKEQELAVETQ